MTTYWHYTCEHGRQAIGDGGMLLPPGAQNPKLFLRDSTQTERLMWSLVWMTDLEHPDIGGLGLTPVELTCERWSYRYRITDDASVISYADMAHMFDMRAQLNLCKPPAMPQHWFVSFCRLPAVYDPVRVVA